MTLAVLAPVAACAVALYVSLLCIRFARAQGWHDQRWFASVAFTGAVYCGLDLFSSDALGPEGVVTAVRAQAVAAGLHVYSWLRYSGAVVRAPPTLWDKGAWVLCGAISLLALIPGALFTGRFATHHFAGLSTEYYDSETTWAGAASWLLFCLGLALVFMRFARGWRNHVSGARGLTVASAVMVIFGLSDTLVGLRLSTAPYLLSAGFLVPIAMMGVTLTNRFVDEARAMHKLEESLEALVSERTQELIATQRALLQAEKLGALGQLAAGVAHEINNPAASVTANLRYVIDGVGQGTVPEDGVEALQESLASMGRIAQVVRQLLITGRMAAGHAPELTSVELRVAADEGIRLARARCGPNGEVVNEIDRELLVRAQEQSLVQVFANLVSNALEAMPAERPHGRVRLVVATTGARIEVRVEDDGAGMGQETLSHLFEPFFSTKPLGKGTGLGLAVSKGLVAGLGGTLRFSSELGKGTTAHLELERSTEALTKVEPVAAPAPPEGPLGRVLLVDDDSAVREAFRRELGLRFTVTAADGVNEAVRLLERDQSWDLVLCDLMMPDGGGEALWDSVTSRWPQLSKRVIFITGGASDERARAFLERQPQPVLNKPLEAAKLLELSVQLDPSTNP